ncbi:AbrB/MazE/SpoVT family DNA-binding domain-containing protein [Carnobacterium maltaromaticum]|uniref:AbrB/MazE/SpoVT family DNA-binding domain-containing protein n=1 Tax=Carnobacterium maltaromaticum TaxID=2751 RepID=UPI00295E7D6F|nr:AbrB/MazE/SpoVT family DNA-binding domain-containing protein [Carnobacterium maltaromaticum]
MNYVAKMTSKGQLTVPVALREALKVKEGDKLEFELDTIGNRMIVKKREIDRGSQLLGLFEGWDFENPKNKEVMNEMMVGLLDKDEPVGGELI